MGALPVMMQLAHRLAQEFPLWAGITVAGYAKYLGFTLGPDRGHRGFSKALTKFADRARAWGHSGGGLFLSCSAYKVYVASVLQFLLQFGEHFSLALVFHEDVQFELLFDRSALQPGLGGQHGIPIVHPIDCCTRWSRSFEK